MKIAVIGSGAIGCLLAGYLKQKGEDVSLVGRADPVSAINKFGLNISGVRGNLNIKINAFEKLNEAQDLVILATKTQDIKEALNSSFNFLQKPLILTTQNGIQADNIAATLVKKENIISSIIMFGATCLEPPKVTHNFEGSWIIGRIFKENDEAVVSLAGYLNRIFPTIVADDILGMKYLKIFVNANNCIPAILGVSMQEAFSDIQISRISVSIWKEGYKIISDLGIKLESLPDFPLERLTKLTSLPAIEAAKIFSGIMMNLSKEPLFGSILQSIKRGKASEVDYINGEFVALAKANNLKASLNGRLVELVHSVENNHKFFSKAELIKITEDLLN